MWVAIGICTVTAAVFAVLLGKTITMKKSVREIAADFQAKLHSDTNTCIDVTSGDKDIRALATQINTQLACLRAERQRYLSGDRELKQAVTNISHDLRTPLTAVYGYLQLLEREEMSPKAAEYLRTVSQRIEELRNLAEEFFRYSIIVTAETDLAPETLDVKEVLEDTLLGYYGALQSQGIEVALTLTDKPILRNLNKNALTRVFSNVLSNVIKYSAGDLTVSLTDEGEIRFINTASDLDEVTVGKLFDRFFTVESGRYSTGLGLSIAKALTEQMGGEIRSEYENGKLHIMIVF